MSKNRRLKAIRAKVDGRDRLIIHEKAIFACRPVIWPHPDMPETPVYPGSVQGTCSICKTDIWIGPKAQEFGDQAQLCCFECSVEQQPDLIANLGNTYLPKDKS